MDGTTTMSVHERKASIREFYGKILFSRESKSFQSLSLYGILLIQAIILLDSGNLSLSTPA